MSSRGRRYKLSTLLLSLAAAVLVMLQVWVGLLAKIMLINHPPRVLNKKTNKRLEIHISQSEQTASGHHAKEKLLRSASRVITTSFPMDTEQQQHHGNNTDYAYAFVIGGCDPATEGYKGFLYNILVATRSLRDQGSVSDVVAFFQMKHSSRAEELPAKDISLLKALQIKVYYIPKSPTESFYDTVMNKFRVLSLTQYRRVFLLDGDVVPVRNMDYLFEVSDSAHSQRPQHWFRDRKARKTKPLVLNENIIIAGAMEPANAGAFMVTPHVGDYDKIQTIIRKRARLAAETHGHEKAPFDQVKGWGHEIKPPDRWTTRSQNRTGTSWTFHFAYSDQGLCAYGSLVERHFCIVVSLCFSPHTSCPFFFNSVPLDEVCEEKR